MQSVVCLYVAAHRQAVRPYKKKYRIYVDIYTYLYTSVPTYI